MASTAPYLVRVQLKPHVVESDDYPFTLPIVRGLDIGFAAPVTFFVFRLRRASSRIPPSTGGTFKAVTPLRTLSATSRQQTRIDQERARRTRLEVDPRVALLPSEIEADKRILIADIEEAIRQRR